MKKHSHQSTSLEGHWPQDNGSLSYTLIASQLSQVAWAAELSLPVFFILGRGNSYLCALRFNTGHHAQSQGERMAPDLTVLQHWKWTVERGLCVRVCPDLSLWRSAVTELDQDHKVAVRLSKERGQSDCAAKDEVSSRSDVQTTATNRNQNE